MARILIPSDQEDFVVHLARAYGRAGHEVFVGKLNFFVQGAHFDMVHYLWPEELSGWAPPSKGALDRVRNALDWWAKNSKAIITVNNLYPHGYEGHEGYTELYNLFYERCAAIVHHSKASRELVTEHFPLTAAKPNFVGNQINFFDLVRSGVDRQKLRAELGIAPDDCVILVFGALRMWSEVELLMKAYSKARIAGKRLLVVARYVELMPMSLWRKRYLRTRWQLWLKRIGAVWVNEYVPDEELHRYFECTDLVVIPRLKDLSSGLIGLGMTFGKIIVAPNHGAFPEYLEGTDNVLYESGNAASFAGAVEKAAKMERQSIGERNRLTAAGWTWDRLVQTCLEAAGINGGTEGDRG